MSERRVINVDEWMRYRAIQTLIAYLRDHPEMIHNIRVQHRRSNDDECYGRCGPWPCLIRCTAEEALRETNAA